MIYSELIPVPGHPLFEDRTIHLQLIAQHWAVIARGDRHFAQEYRAHGGGGDVTKPGTLAWLEKCAIASAEQSAIASLRARVSAGIEEERP